MKYVIAIVAAIVTFFVVVLWSCMVVASRADEQMGISDSEEESG